MASDVPSVARAFNSPLHLRRTPKSRHSSPSSSSSLGRFFRIEPGSGSGGVVIDTIKRGEDDDFLSAVATAPQTVILRLYESMGGHGRVVIDLCVVGSSLHPWFG